MSEELELTFFDLSAPRPWDLVDKSSDQHPSVSVVSKARSSAIAYKYAPMPHEVHDFHMIVEAVNAYRPAETPQSIPSEREAVLAYLHNYADRIDEDRPVTGGDMSGTVRIAADAIARGEHLSTRQAPIEGSAK